MNWKKFVALASVLLVALLIGSTRVNAQTATTGDVTGTVSDPSNAVVPGAEVTLKDLSKGSTQTVKSSKDGVFHFYLLEPGNYSLTVTATGFQTTSQLVTVGVGHITVSDVRLTVGSANQTITVTEAPPLIQTENGDSARTLTQQQVQNVPNPGNDLSAIAQLAPGAIMNTQGGYGNVEAFGLPATSNLFTTDGMDDNDPFLNLNNSGATNLLLGSNEIQEADVVTNGFSTTYGTFSGINVNYITKSGGDEFHGNGVYYWNGRALNANDWFNKAYGEPRSFDNANQWAASIGGPIKKDKMFFFVNTEGLRVLIPVPSTINIPTPAFESAVLQNLTNLGDSDSIPYYCQNPTGGCPAGSASVPGVGAGIFNLFNGVKNQANASSLATGSNQIVTGTAPNQVTHNITTGPGCSNAVLANFFTDVATNPDGSAAAPLPGSVASPGACAVGVFETPVNFAPEWQISGRFDWVIGANDRFYVRMQHDNGAQPTSTDPVDPIFSAISYQPEYQGQLQETHTFGPTLTNQFLVAATWYTAIFGPPDLSASLAAFPTTLIMGDNSLGGNGDCGFGLSSSGCVWPQGRNVTQFQLGDDISKTIGNHTLKFGAKYHKNYVSDHDFGLFSSGLEEPISLADFVNGGDTVSPECATTTAINNNVNCLATIGTVFLKSYAVSLNQPVRLYEVAGYIQDDWRIKSNLTISPGLRLEHASNPTCVTLCFGNLGVPYDDIGTVAPYNQLIQINRRQALFGYQNLQWEPRIGFAWQPFSTDTGFWKSNLVVRGGAGIFYDIFPGQISDNMAQNSPLYNQYTIYSASIGGSCTGYLSPTQNAGTGVDNLFDCANAAQSAFVNAFNTGSTELPIPPNITFTQPKTEAPQYQKWNLEVQKGFGANDSISIGYNGNHGIHEPIFVNSLNAYGFGSLPENPASSQFGEVDGEQSVGVSNYNGVTVSFQHRFSGWGGSGVFQLNYTYSHAFDDVSNGGFDPFTGNSIESLQNPFDRQANYGPADYDARHVVNANYVWEIPIRKALGGRGWAPLVDGWQVSGTIFYRTGFPYTITDAELSGDLNSQNYFSSVYPVPLTSVPRTCAGEVHAGPNGVPCYTVSTPSTPGEFPVAGPVPAGGPANGAIYTTGFAPQGWRNAYRGPNYFDTDFSFTKKTKIPHWERGEFQLGLQFFNLFNHYNFTLPVSDTSDGTYFGTIQGGVNPPTSILGSFLGGQAAPRLIQVKAQFVF